jgi:hypothetical protein
VPAYCFDHPTRAADGACEPCGRAWCGECLSAAKLHVTVCKTCGRAAGALLAEGAGEFVGRLMSRDGVAMAVGLGVFGALISLISSGGAIAMGWAFVMAWVIYASCVVGTFFAIIQHVGAGRAGMPHAVDADHLSTMFARVGRGLVCFGVGLAPLAVWWFAGHGRDPVMAGVMLVLGQLYMPAVLVAVTVSDHTGNALWPPVWVQIVARAPAAYARFAVVWVVTVFVGGAVVGAAEAAVADAVPVVGDMVATTLGMLFLFAQAILVGQFLRRNSVALEY